MAAPPGPGPGRHPDALSLWCRSTEADWLKGDGHPEARVSFPVSMSTK